MLSLETKTNAFDTLVAFIKQIISPSADDQRKVSDAVRKGWEENFTGERSGSGAAWAPLSPQTILERTRRGYGANPILVQSGALRSSLLVPGASNSQQEFRTDGAGWTLVMGTTDPKAVWHEKGTRRMPARPFIDLSSNAQTGVETVIEAMIARIEAQTVGK